MILRFRKLDVPVGEIPAIDELARVTRLCLKESMETRNTREQKFFKHAGAILEQDTIPVLAVEDSNTTGADEPAFKALAKSTGVTLKTNSDSGGSFGIGKHAAFAVSDLRTVFYATRHENGELYQGKTLYRSHQDETKFPENSRRSTGYWGKSFEPVKNPSSVPQWMVRKQKGTTVFCLGMRSSGTADIPHAWAWETLTVLAINFFVAIHEKAVEFRLDTGTGKLVGLTRENLAKTILENSKIEETAKRLRIDDDLVRARALYTCLSAPAEAVEESRIHIEGAGKFDLRLMMQDELGYSCGIIRNGMFITDGFGEFGDKFRRFNMYRSFALLVRPADKQTSATMKTLENPSHDKLTSQRIVDPGDREVIDKAFGKLASSVREFIKTHARTIVTGAQDLDEMNEFFAMDDDKPDAGTDNSPTEIRITQISTKVEQPKQRRRKSGGVDAEAGGKGGAGTREGRGGITDGPETGDGGGIEPGEGNKPVVDFSPAGADDIRIVAGSNGPVSRKVFFTPDKTGTLRVSLKAQGLNNDELLHFALAGQSAMGTKVNIEGRKGERVCVEVVLSENYRGALTLTCEARPSQGDS